MRIKDYQWQVAPRSDVSQKAIELHGKHQTIIGPELARESAYLERTIVTLWHMANKVTQDKQADVHIERCQEEIMIDMGFLSQINIHNGG